MPAFEFFEFFVVCFFVGVFGTFGTARTAAGFPAACAFKIKFVFIELKDIFLCFFAEFFDFTGIIRYHSFIAL